MDTSADARGGRCLVDRLAAAGLKAPAIREVCAVFHLIAWASRCRDERDVYEGLQDRGFARPLLARARFPDLSSLDAEEIVRVLDDLATDLGRPPEPHEGSFPVYLAALAASVSRVSRADIRILRQVTSWITESFARGELSHSALLQSFDEIVLATGDSDRWPLEFPGFLDQLVNEMSGSGPAARTPQPHLNSADFLAGAAEYAIAEIQRRGNDRSGLDLSAPQFALGVVRLILSGAGISPTWRSDPSEGSAFTPKADFVLVNPPFGTRFVRELQRQEEFLISIRDPEGLFIRRALEQLAPDGRATVIVPIGFFFRGGKTQELRRWLVEEGYLEAAVRLPSGIFLRALGLTAGILVLDKKGGNESIRIIDASVLGPLHQKTEPEIEVIRSSGARRTLDIRYRLSSADPASEGTPQLCKAWDVSPRDLAKRRWILMGSQTDSLSQRWLRSGLGESLAELGQVVPLSSCARVKVGYYMAAKNLVSEPPADDALGYFRIADIHEGVAEKVSLWVLPPVAKNMVPEQLLQTGDVLLSRSGTVDKAGVVCDNVHAIACGGILVIHIDPERLDARFLVAYLRCTESRAWLKDNSHRTVMPNLTVPLLNGMRVPLPALPLQRRAAARFQESGVDVLDFLNQAMGLPERAAPKGSD